MAVQHQRRDFHLAFDGDITEEGALELICKEMNDIPYVKIMVMPGDASDVEALIATNSLKSFMRVQLDDGTWKIPTFSSANYIARLVYLGKNTAAREYHEKQHVRFKTSKAEVAFLRNGVRDNVDADDNSDEDDYHNPECYHQPNEFHKAVIKMVTKPFNPLQHLRNIVQFYDPKGSSGKTTLINLLRQMKNEKTGTQLRVYAPGVINWTRINMHIRDNVVDVCILDVPRGSSLTPAFYSNLERIGNAETTGTSLVAGGARRRFWVLVMTNTEFNFKYITEEKVICIDVLKAFPDLQHPPLFDANGNEHTPTKDEVPAELKRGLPDAPAPPAERPAARARRTVSTKVAWQLAMQYYDMLPRRRHEVRAANETALKYLESFEAGLKTHIQLSRAYSAEHMIFELLNVYRHDADWDEIFEGAHISMPGPVIVFEF